ncbi:hypothetical protein AVEN_134833-1 [Araneus ventricosus]|uniref:Uncharacterized protein n=1 Tax=Araneus ventricosus TaxID=182803 RepID=A0A4Y2J914_ARAVE|nr:hypothetical protein AVEN_134833-1 [Araneus ventricosus]
MLPNRLLQQYVFHMTAITGDNTLQASQKSSNARVQQAMIVDSWFTLNNFTYKALSYSTSRFTCYRRGLGAQVLITVSFANFHRSRLYQCHLLTVLLVIFSSLKKKIP